MSVVMDSIATEHAGRGHCFALLVPNAKQGSLLVLFLHILGMNRPGTEFATSCTRSRPIPLCNQGSYIAINWLSFLLQARYMPPLVIVFPFVEGFFFRGFHFSYFAFLCRDSFTWCRSIITYVIPSPLGFITGARLRFALYPSEWKKIV